MKEHMVFKVLTEVISDTEMGRNKEDGGRLFSLVFSERRRGNGDKVKQEIPLKHKKKNNPLRVL